MGLYKGGYVYVEPGGPYTLIIQSFYDFVKSYAKIYRFLIRIQIKIAFVKLCDKILVLTLCNV